MPKKKRIRNPPSPRIRQLLFPFGELTRREKIINIFQENKIRIRGLRQNPNTVQLEVKIWPKKRKKDYFWLWSFQDRIERVALRFKLKPKHHFFANKYKSIQYHRRIFFDESGKPVFVFEIHTDSDNSDESIDIFPGTERAFFAFYYDHPRAATIAQAIANFQNREQATHKHSHRHHK